MDAVFSFQKVTSLLGSRPLFTELEADLEAGRIHVILGQNGAGKSSLLFHLNGVYLPDSGCIYYQGQPIREQLFKVRKEVGFVFQKPASQFLTSSVREELLFGPRNFGLAKSGEEDEVIAPIVEEFHLGDLLERSPFQISGGEQRRLSLASVLVCQPKVLLLDEPLTFLDDDGEAFLLEKLESLLAQGLTVIVASHRLRSFLSLEPKVWSLEQGKLRERE